MGLWWALALAVLALSSGCWKKRKAKKGDVDAEEPKRGRNRAAVVWTKAGKNVRPLPIAVSTRTDERPTTNTSVSASGSSLASGSKEESAEALPDPSTRRSDPTALHRSVLATPRLPSRLPSSLPSRLPHTCAEGSYSGLKAGTGLEKDVEVLVDTPTSSMPASVASDKLRLLDACSASQRQRECAARLEAFVRELSVPP